MRHCEGTDNVYASHFESIEKCCSDQMVTLPMLRMLVKEKNEEALKEIFYKLGLRVLVKQAFNDTTAAKVMAIKNQSLSGSGADHTTSMARSAHQGQGRIEGKGSEPKPAAVAPVLNNNSNGIGRFANQLNPLRNQGSVEYENRRRALMILLRNQGELPDMQATADQLQDTLSKVKLRKALAQTVDLASSCPSPTHASALPGSSSCDQSIDMQLAVQALKSLGYSDFRDCQEEVIQSTMEGRDTVGILQTGSGKSLCFMVPAKIHADREKGATRLWSSAR